MFRTFPVASSLKGRREELDYDDTKNCILEIEEDLRELRTKLKLVKKNSETRYGHDLGDVERHIKQDMHQHMQSLNQVSDNY
jgi:phage-related minor tail protein